MAWVAVNKDKTETIFTNKPMRVDICGFNVWDVSTDLGGYYIHIPKGSIKKLIGKDLTWEDEPIELEQIVNYNKKIKMDKVKENLQDNNSLFILCNNYCAEGWNAVAVWNHKPTKEDILKVGLFKEYPDRNIEQSLSERIAKYGKCRLNFIDYKKYNDHWIEYIVINPDENGDLNLTDLLITGHCDYIEKCNIYQEDFI